jgi:shikimate kinase
MVHAHVLLIGPSGVGKSTVGALLADALALPFHDSDTEIERAAGRSVASLFADEGEAGFRVRERATIATLVAGAPAVIAIGGGALADRAAATMLASRGPIVLLDATPATLAARLGAAADRPLLVGAPDLIARLEAQRLDRDLLYRASAAHVIATDALTPAAVATAVLAWLATAPR